MPNLNAALGCAQLEQLPNLLLGKRHLTGRYQSAFSGVPGVSLMIEPSGCKSNYWLQTLILASDDVEARDAVLAATNEAGYMTRPVWDLMHELPPYKKSPRMDLAGAQSLAKRLINIPSSAGLGGG